MIEREAHREHPAHRVADDDRARDARVLATGKGVFELTGYREGDLVKLDMLVAGEPVDVGPGGMCITCSRPLAADEVLGFELQPRINGRASSRSARSSWSKSPALSARRCGR